MLVWPLPGVGAGMAAARRRSIPRSWRPSWLLLRAEAARLLSAAILQFPEAL